MTEDRDEARPVGGEEPGGGSGVPPSEDSAAPVDGMTPAQQEEGIESAEMRVEDLESQLEAERKRAGEYLENWQRARADFLNLKKRTEQEKAELAKFANAELIGRLLYVVDDFERAIQTMPVDLLKFSWMEGILIIYRKLLSLLEQEGLEPVEAAGKDFDPVLHEAVLFDDDAQGVAEIVTAEMQRGYKLHGRVLRPTLVKVGKRTSDQVPKDNTE